MNTTEVDGAPEPIFLAGDDEPSARLREFAFAALVREPVPVEPARLVAMSRLAPDFVSAALDRLAAAGRIDRDASGRVLGSAGLTIADAPHGLTMGGHAYRTWCAFDALGIPAAMGTDARVETACAVCDRPIQVAVAAGRAPTNSAVRLWLSAGGADMRADFCTPTVMLCSEAHAAEWSTRQGQHGAILNLEAAAAHGFVTWRSAADVALAHARS